VCVYVRACLCACVFVRVRVCICTLKDIMCVVEGAQSLLMLTCHICILVSAVFIAVTGLTVQGCLGLCDDVALWCHPLVYERG